MTTTTLPPDLVRLAVIVGNVYVKCDVAIGKTVPLLDDLERRVRRESTAIVGRRLSAAELTDSIGRMAAAASAVGNDSFLIRTAIWLAFRGSHSAVSLDELIARAGRCSLTISTTDPDGSGPSWRFQVSDMAVPLDDRPVGVSVH